MFEYISGYLMAYKLPFHIKLEYMCFSIAAYMHLYKPYSIFKENKKIIISIKM